MKNSNNTVRNYLLKLSTLSIILLISGFVSGLQAQTSFKLIEGSQIKVSGTSNIHDWSMLSKNLSSDANFIVKNEILQEISSLNFSLPVASLKSKDDLMDTRAHKTLKAAQFNKISFKLTEATVVPQKKIVNVVGNLTFAGVTNKIVLQTTYILNADETITYKGTKVIKMSDFKIKAPSFMLGALKTGNEVSIDLFLKFKKSNINAINNK